MEHTLALVRSKKALAATELQKEYILQMKSYVEWAKLTLAQQRLAYETEISTLKLDNEELQAAHNKLLEESKTQYSQILELQDKLKHWEQVAEDRRRALLDTRPF